MEKFFTYCHYITLYISIYFLSHGFSYKIEILEVFIFVKYIV